VVLRVSQGWEAHQILAIHLDKISVFCIVGQNVRYFVFLVRRFVARRFAGGRLAFARCAPITRSSSASCVTRLSRTSTIGYDS